MSTSYTYHLIGHLLSLALHPGKRNIIRDKLHNPRFHWVKLITTGSNHLVLPAMYIRIKNAELLPLLPEFVAEHLENIYLLNLERNNAVISQAQEIIRILEQENIEVMFLKGLGNIFDGLYSSPGERMIQDIDIMVTGDKWELAINMLKQHGYRCRAPFKADMIPPRKHYPRLFKDESTASIELHRFPVITEFNVNFDTDEIWEAKIPVKNTDHVFVMSDKHKIIHNFIHSQLEHRGHFYGRIFLRNLYDQFLLSERVNPRDVLENWNVHQRKTAAYLEVMRRTFYPENKKDKLSVCKTGFYPLRYELFLHCKLLSTGMHMIVKMFRSYVRKPVLAITDRELRQTLIRNISDRSWYRKHVRSYRKYFRM